MRPRRRLWPCGFAGCQETVRRCRAARLFLSRNAATGVGIKNKKAGTQRSPTPPPPGLHPAPPSCLAASPPLLSVVAPSRHQCNPHVYEWHTAAPTFLKGCLAAIRRLVNLKHCSLPPLLLLGVAHRGPCSYCRPRSAAECGELPCGAGATGKGRPRAPPPRSQALFGWPLAFQPALACNGTAGEHRLSGERIEPQAVGPTLE